MWKAGGAIRGGTSYGETSGLGYAASIDPVHIHDLHATLPHLLSLDHKRSTFRFRGPDYKLTDVSGEVIWPWFADPVHIHDLHATLLHLLSLDHKRSTFRFQCPDYKLIDVSGEVIWPWLA